MHPRTSWSPLAACSLHSSIHSPREWRPSRSSSSLEAESTALRRLSAADRYRSLDLRRLAFWKRSRPCCNMRSSSLAPPAAAPPVIRNLCVCVCVSYIYLRRHGCLALDLAFVFLWFLPPRLLLGRVLWPWRCHSLFSSLKCPSKTLVSGFRS